MSSFLEIYKMYLDNQINNEKLQILIEDMFKAYNIDDPEPIYEKEEIDKFLDLVIKNKDFKTLFFVFSLEEQWGNNLFTPGPIHDFIIDNNLKDEWYEYIKNNYNDENKHFILRYISFTNNIELFDKVFSEDKLKQIIKNKKDDLKIFLDYFQYIQEILDKIVLFIDYEDPELSEICKNSQNKFIPFYSTIYNVVIPIQYYIDSISPLHLLKDKNIIHENSTMTFNIYKSQYNKGLSHYFNQDQVKIDKYFFKRNQDFLESLSLRELFILSGYTWNGDQLVNLSILSKTLDPKHLASYDSYIMNWKKTDKQYKKKLIPIYYQLSKFLNIKSHDALNKFLLKVNRDENFLNIIKTCVDEYLIELKDIFAKAPALEDEMIVYRGVTTMYYKKDNSDIFYNNTFMSTSINPATAIKFSDVNCCIKKITLKPGFKNIIFMEPITQIRNEYELLIAPDIKFKITSHEDLRKESSFSLDNYIEKWISNDSSEEYKYIDFKKALCNDDTNLKTFTTMESV